MATATIFAKSTNPGCCGCPSDDPVNCGVTISGTFKPLAGVWCATPQTLYYTISGTTAAGGSLNYAGQIAPGSFGPAPNYAFAVTLNGATIPDGSYTLHLYEYGTNNCQTTAGPTGRFDLSQSITVKCGEGPVSVVLPAQFDILGPLSTNFGAGGCLLGPAANGGLGSTTCYGDVLTLTVNTVASGGSICRSTTTANGNVSGVYLRATSYPAAVSFTGTVPNCLPSSQTTSTTWTACNASTTTGNASGGFVYKKWPIAVHGCGSAVPQQYHTAISGASVTMTGQYNGAGVTNGSDDGTDGGSPCGLAFITLDSINPNATDTTWTVSKARFVTATFSQSALTAAKAANQPYAGTLCPVGGILTPAAGYHCAGCPDTPLPETLHATVLGESIILTWNPPGTPFGGSFGGWVGDFSHPVAGLKCNDLSGGHAVGPVSMTFCFYSINAGNNGAPPYALGQVNFAPGRAGVPTLCPADGHVPYGATLYNRFWGGSNPQLSCGGAFMWQSSGDTWSYNFSPQPEDQYVYPVAITISE